MDLDRSDQIKVAKFSAFVLQRFKPDMPHLTKPNLKAALLMDTNICQHILEQGAGLLFDADLKAQVIELVKAIPESKRGPKGNVEEKRKAILEDLQNGNGLSKYSKTALVNAYCQGAKGDQKADLRNQVEAVAFPSE